MQLNQLEIADTPVGVFVGCAATAAMMAGQEVDLRDVDLKIQVGGQEVDVRRVLTMWAATPQAKRATSLATTAPAEVVPVAPVAPLPVVVVSPAQVDAAVVAELRALLDHCDFYLASVENESFLSDDTLENGLARISRVALEEFVHLDTQRLVKQRLDHVRDAMLAQQGQDGGTPGSRQRELVRNIRSNIGAARVKLADA